MPEDHDVIAVLRQHLAAKESGIQAASNRGEEDVADLLRHQHAAIEQVLREVDPTYVPAQAR